MASIRDIKLKIESTENIEHITKAMKMVAAARLKKAQERLESARPYARKMAEVTIDLAVHTSWSFNKLLRPHSASSKVLIIVFTGDKGLAGGFHNNIVDRALDFGDSLKSQKISYYVIGNKGYHRFVQKNVELFKYYRNDIAGTSYIDARKLGKEITRFYTKEEFDVIYLYYAKFYSAMRQKPRAFQLLPIDPNLDTTVEHGLFIFEPGRKVLLDDILPRYVESEIFRAFLETEAGELGSRMTAMSAATDSAEEIIGDCRLKFNRLRQEKITREITEIIGAVDALKRE